MNSSWVNEPRNEQLMQIVITNLTSSHGFQLNFQCLELLPKFCMMLHYFLHIDYPAIHLGIEYLAFCHYNQQKSIHNESKARSKGNQCRFNYTQITWSHDYLPPDLPNPCMMLLIHRKAKLFLLVIYPLKPHNLQIGCRARKAHCSFFEWLPWNRQKIIQHELIGTQCRYNHTQLTWSNDFLPNLCMKRGMKLQVHQEANSFLLVMWPLKPHNLQIGLEIGCRAKETHCS